MRKAGFALLVLLQLAFVLNAQTADQIRRAKELFQQGLVFQEAGQYDAAIQRYTAYIAIRPERANVYYNRALCYSGKGEFDLAIADLTRSLARDASKADGWLARGQMYFAKRVLGAKFSDLAIADLDRAIKIDPANGTAYRTRGQAYAEIRKDAQALSDFNKAIQLIPKDADAYYQRGNIRSSRGSYELAAADFRTALRLDPKHPYAKGWLDYANGEIAKSRPKTALPPKTAAPVVVAADWRAAADAGKAYLAQNDARNSIISLKRALSLAPSDRSSTTARLYTELNRSKINEDLARAYKLSGNTDLAIEAYSAAQKPLLEALQAGVLERQNDRVTSAKFADLIKSKYDADIALYGILAMPGVELVAIGQRALDAFPSGSLTQDQSMKLLSVGLLKVMSAELTAQIFLTTSTFRHLQADLCKRELSDICGPASRKNQVPAYTNDSLKDINKAISIAPALKRLYLHRAKVYRSLGQTNLALADETKAAQLKG
ncbi:MAG: tetratricopeptide repeat protein [Pyrinomonadaceae bacterium]